MANAKYDLDNNLDMTLLRSVYNMQGLDNKIWLYVNDILKLFYTDISHDCSITPVCMI